MTKKVIGWIGVALGGALGAIGSELLGQWLDGKKEKLKEKVIDAKEKED